MIRFKWDWRTWTVGVAIRDEWAVFALLCARLYVRLRWTPPLKTYGFAAPPNLRVVK